MLTFRIYLQEPDTKKSYKTFNLLTTQNKTKQDKTDKIFKIRSITDHLNESFQAAFSNKPEQNIDEHMTKFKRCSLMRQYLKIKPIKWGFKSWFWCASSEKLKGNYCTLFLDSFLTA